MRIRWRILRRRIEGRRRRRRRRRPSPCPLPQAGEGKKASGRGEKEERGGRLVLAFGAEDGAVEAAYADQGDAEAEEGEDAEQALKLGGVDQEDLQYGRGEEDEAGEPQRLVRQPHAGEDQADRDDEAGKRIAVEFGDRGFRAGEDRALEELADHQGD